MGSGALQDPFSRFTQSELSQWTEKRMPPFAEHAFVPFGFVLPAGPCLPARQSRSGRLFLPDPPPAPGSNDRVG
jgi:hypothetical protein